MVKINHGYYLGDCYGIYRGRTACKRQYMFDVFLYDQEETLERAYYKKRSNEWIRVDKEKTVSALKLDKIGMLHISDRIMFYDNEGILRCGKIEYINPKDLIVFYLGKVYKRKLSECFSYETLNGDVQERRNIFRTLQLQKRADLPENTKDEITC